MQTVSTAYAIFWRERAFSRRFDCRRTSCLQGHGKPDGAAYGASRPHRSGLFESCIHLLYASSGPQFAMVLIAVLARRTDARGVFDLIFGFLGWPGCWQLMHRQQLQPLLHPPSGRPPQFMREPSRPAKRTVMRVPGVCGWPASAASSTVMVASCWVAISCTMARPRPEPSTLVPSAR